MTEDPMLIAPRLVEAQRPTGDPIPGGASYWVSRTGGGLLFGIQAADGPDKGAGVLIDRHCWPGIVAAVAAIEAEAQERARQVNAFEQLVDPIDGPNGEA